MDGILGKMKEIEDRRAGLIKGGSQKEIDRQHAQGKFTARERIDMLFDKETFRETNLWIRSQKTGFAIDERELPADGVITGLGEIHGRPFYTYAHDFTVGGGTFGTVFHHKVTRIMEMALEKRIPYIGIIDSGGERIQDWFGMPAFRPMYGGKKAVGGTLTMYRAPGIISGVIPQITLMLGPMYAGSAYSPTMADFMIMRRKTSFMSVASPSLLKAVTSQDVTQDDIGGAELHAAVTGTADFLAETDEEAIAICKELVSYLPPSYMEPAPIVDLGDSPNRRDERLRGIASLDGEKPYDMRDVIRCIVDNGQFLELQKLFAKSMIIGFGRLNGQTVGIVANNPAVSKGGLTIDTCDKEARFVRWCDAFNVPLIFLVDTAGFLLSEEQEQSVNGLIRTIPKPVFAICESTVPMITVYIGECAGSALLCMGTLRMGVDVAFSWPTARVARMDPRRMVDILYDEEIKSSRDPDSIRSLKVSQILQETIQHPYHGLEKGMVNDIIDPADTRPVLIDTLNYLTKKEPKPRPWRKHGLIPQ